MIPKGCNRLTKVDFLIAEVSRHAAQAGESRSGTGSRRCSTAAGVS